MTDRPTGRDDFCYRHPDRQSFVLCQRCGRTICPACQTQASVGVHCPECVREARANAPRRPPVTTRWARAVTARRSSAPVVTYAIIAICVLVYAAQFFGGYPVNLALVFFEPYVLAEPWRLLTSMVAHGGILHLLLNMLSLFFLGRALEPALGRSRFLTLFLVSGFGGAAAVAVISPLSPVFGASGAIFGLLAALVVLQRRVGGDVRQLVILMAINLVYGFIVSGISWEAHVGGIVAGLLAGVVLARTRGMSRGRQFALMGLVGAAMLAVVFVRALI